MSNLHQKIFLRNLTANLLSGRSVVSLKCYEKRFIACLVGIGEVKVKIFKDLTLKILKLNKMEGGSYNGKEIFKIKYNFLTCSTTKVGEVLFSISHEYEDGKYKLVKITGSAQKVVSEGDISKCLEKMREELDKEKKSIGLRDLTLYLCDEWVHAEYKEEIENFLRR